MSGTPVSSDDKALLVSMDAAGKRILLDVSEVRIGRGLVGDNDISISPDDARASREHARIIFDGGQWLLEDKSTNGTLVNGELVHKKRVPLRQGTRIKIGQTFDYAFSTLGDTVESSGFPTAIQPNGGSLTHETPQSTTGIWISGSASIWRDGERLPANLSRTEYRLLTFLSHRYGEVCDYETTIHAVWGAARDKDSLHELIYRVRRKIEPDPAQPRYLIIRAGIGVVFFPQGVDNAA